MTREQAEKYYENKRLEVLKEIEPLLSGFMKMKKEVDYDYIIDFENSETTHPNEWLKVRDVKIGCNANSVEAVVEEAFGYCFVRYYARKRYIGAFKNQTLNVIKRYWSESI